MSTFKERQTVFAELAQRSDTALSIVDAAMDEITRLREENGAQKANAQKSKLIECLRIGQEIQRAARDLPEPYELHIHVEKGSGWVVLTTPEGAALDYEDDGDGFSYSITKAIDEAMKGGAA